MSWLPVVVGAAKNRVVALKTDRSIRFSLSRIFFASSSSLVPNFEIRIEYESKAKIRDSTIAEIITRAISAILSFAFYPITLLHALLFVY